MSLHNSCVEALTQKCDHIWRWRLWKVISFKWSHKGGAGPPDGIGGLIRRHSRACSLSLYVHKNRLCEHTVRWWPQTSQENRPQDETYFAGTFILDFPVSRTERNNLLLFISHQVCGIFVTAAPTKTFPTSFSWIIHNPLSNRCLSNRILFSSTRGPCKSWHCAFLFFCWRHQLSTVPLALLLQVLATDRLILFPPEQHGTLNKGGTKGLYNLLFPLSQSFSQVPRLVTNAHLFRSLQSMLPQRPSPNQSMSKHHFVSGIITTFPFLNSRIFSECRHLSFFIFLK